MVHNGKGDNLHMLGYRGPYNYGYITLYNHLVTQVSEIYPRGSTLWQSKLCILQVKKHRDLTTHRVHLGVYYSTVWNCNKTYGEKSPVATPGKSPWFVGRNICILHQLLNIGCNIPIFAVYTSIYICSILSDIYVYISITLYIYMILLLQQITSCVCIYPLVI